MAVEWPERKAKADRGLAVHVPDVYSPKVRSYVMSRIRKTDTKPELAVRHLLHRMGYRFRLHRRDLPGTPDIVLPKHRTVVFVHGCFWHQHTCKLGKKPKSNLTYWLPKLERNRTRFTKDRRKLRRLGWRVAVVWECETFDPAKLERLLRSHLAACGMSKAAQRGCPSRRPK